MTSEILSPQEVESLLGAMDRGGAVPAGEPPRKPPAAIGGEKITPYDFKRPERVGKEQMRALADAARGFRPQLRRRAVRLAAEHRRGQAHAASTN